jgi:hypothetical protein
MEQEAQNLSEQQREISAVPALYPSLPKSKARAIDKLPLLPHRLTRSPHSQLSLNKRKNTVDHFYTLQEEPKFAPRRVLNAVKSSFQQVSAVQSRDKIEAMSRREVWRTDLMFKRRKLVNVIQDPANYA